MELNLIRPDSPAHRARKGVRSRVLGSRGGGGLGVCETDQAH